MLTAVTINAFFWMFFRDRDSIIDLKTTVKMSYLTKSPRVSSTKTRMCLLVHRIGDASLDSYAQLFEASASSTICLFSTRIRSKGVEGKMIAL